MSLLYTFFCQSWRLPRVPVCHDWKLKEEAIKGLLFFKHQKDAFSFLLEAFGGWREGLEKVETKRLLNAFCVRCWDCSISPRWSKHLILVHWLRELCKYLTRYVINLLHSAFELREFDKIQRNINCCETQWKFHYIFTDDEFIKLVNFLPRSVCRTTLTIKQIRSLCRSLTCAWRYL